MYFIPYAIMREGERAKEMNFYLFIEKIKPFLRNKQSQKSIEDHTPNKNYQ